MLRGKVEAVLARAELPPASHDEKRLLEILETFQRDALMQISEDELFEIAIGLLGLGERPWVRLFVWRDPLDRFVSCLVTVPRDRYNTDNRERIGRVLLEAFSGRQLDWTVQLSESVLARVTYVLRCSDGIPDDYDVAAIQDRLVHVTRAWTDDLRVALIAEHGEQEGLRLYRRYWDAFRPAYRSDTDAATAVEDVDRLERMLEREGAMISLYDAQSGGRALRCKLYSSGGVSLSEVLPTFEHMGARVVDERPYRVQPDGADPVWIYDFGLRLRADDVNRLGDCSRRRSSTPAGATRGRRAQRARAGGRATGKRGDDPPRDRALPPAGWNRLLGRVHGTYAGRSPGHRAVAGEDVPRPAGPRPARHRARRTPRPGDREGHQRRPEPRRGPDPARLPGGRRATVRTNYFRRDPSEPPEYLSFKLEPAQRPGGAGAAADVRDLRLLAALRGRAPARRQGRARRDSLVGPAARISAPRCWAWSRRRWSRTR